MIVRIDPHIRHLLMDGPENGRVGIGRIVISGHANAAGERHLGDDDHIPNPLFIQSSDAGKEERRIPEGVDRVHIIAEGLNRTMTIKMNAFRHLMLKAVDLSKHDRAIPLRAFAEPVTWPGGHADERDLFHARLPGQFPQRVHAGGKASDDVPEAVPLGQFLFDMDTGNIHS